MRQNSMSKMIYDLPHGRWMLIYRMSNMLIYRMGDEVDDILKSFTFAEKERMTYETVKGSLMHISFLMEQFRKELCSTAEDKKRVKRYSFIAALYALLEHCQYDNFDPKRDNSW